MQIKTVMQSLFALSEPSMGDAATEGTCRSWTVPETSNGTRTAHNHKQHRLSELICYNTPSGDASGLQQSSETRLHVLISPRCQR